jgi:hypothetical protein
MTTMRADDALKYAAALLKSRTGWALDSIGGALCDGDHEAEVDATYDAINEVHRLATLFGDPRRYSDGRLVESSAEIEYGLVTSHVWHPIPACEEISSSRGPLPSGDPDLPSPGVFEVTTYPAEQRIHTRTVRLA